MAKKTTPTTPITKAQVKKLAQTRTLNRAEGRADAADGRDTRMSRDGGTGRRTRS